MHKKAKLVIAVGAGLKLMGYKDKYSHSFIVVGLLMYAYDALSKRNLEV